MLPQLAGSDRALLKGSRRARRDLRRAQPEDAPHAARHVARMREACFQRDIGAALLAFHQAQTRALDASLEDEAVHGYARRLLEQRFEVRHAESRHIRQFDERQVFVEMRFDVLDHAAQPPRG